MFMQTKINLQLKDSENQEVKALKQEISSLRDNLNFKEYMLQFNENRSTKIEELIKTYIPKFNRNFAIKLRSLLVVPSKQRTITSVIEECNDLKEHNEILKRENKALKEKLDFALTCKAADTSEMSIFKTDMKPTPLVEDLNKIKLKATSEQVYIHKLEEMLK